MTSKAGWIPLSQLCEAIVDCEHKTAPIQGWGIPSIRTTNIKNGRLDIENANRVSEETYKLWTARLEPQPGDLILAREAPVGAIVGSFVEKILLNNDENQILTATRDTLLPKLLSGEIRVKDAEKVLEEVV